MKKIALLCLASSLYLFSGAQTTAADFEKPDCAGTNHHLYTELDSGFVCLLDFVMFDCSPCVTATNALETIHAQFEASHPGKVRFYSMGFLNFMSCSQMNNWKTVNQYTHTVFSGESSQVEYYGGMGMPTIVILGGRTAHKVYYNHQGYTSSENAPLINAINLAISESSTSGANQLPGDEQFNAFPNPFDGALTVTVQTTQATHIVLTDLTGKEILRQDVPSGFSDATLTLPTGHLPAGLYFVSLMEGARQIGLRKVVKE